MATPLLLAFSPHSQKDNTKWSRFLAIDIYKQKQRWGIERQIIEASSGGGNLDGGSNAIVDQPPNVSFLVKEYFVNVPIVFVESLIMNFVVLGEAPWLLWFHISLCSAFTISQCKQGNFVG